MLSVRTVVCYLRTANAGTPGQHLLARQRVKLEHKTAAQGWTVLEWIEDLHQSGAQPAQARPIPGSGAARRPSGRRAACL
jgi:hypothetical protein